MQQQMTKNYQFDANQHEASMGNVPVPADTYVVRVTDIKIEPFKDPSSGEKYTLELTIQEGTYAGKKVWQGFNLWHINPQTADIGHKELAGVCQVTGIFQLNMQTGGKELMQAVYNARVVVGEYGNNVKAVSKFEGQLAATAPVAAAPMAPAMAMPPVANAPMPVAAAPVMAPAPAPVMPAQAAPALAPAPAPAMAVAQAPQGYGPAPAAVQPAPVAQPQVAPAPAQLAPAPAPVPVVPGVAAPAPTVMPWQQPAQ